ncbi:MAG: lysylphosphatidylglycerol synthase domain-containing protein [Bacteroidia bacterium]
MERKKSLMRLFNRSIKVAIVIVALLYIVRKLSGMLEAYFYLYDTKGFVSAHVPEMILVIALLPLNWLLEAIKWKILIQDLEPMSLGRSFRSVLVGVTLGTATPNRVGEFGGRVFFLKTADRIAATGRAFVGSFMQTFVTLVFGLFGFWFLSGKVTYTFLNDGFFFQTLILVLLVVVLFFVFVFLFSKFSSSTYISIFLQKIKAAWDAIKSVGVNRQVVVFGLSFLRYLVYSFQFLIVLRVFGDFCNLSETFAAITITYFAITVIPTFALTEVVVRGSAAVYFIGALPCSSSLVLVASLLIWTLNIALPALIGMFFVFQLRFFTSKNKQDDGTGAV